MSFVLFFTFHCWTLLLDLPYFPYCPFHNFHRWILFAFLFSDVSFNADTLFLLEVARSLILAISAGWHCLLLSRVVMDCHTKHLCYKQVTKIHFGLSSSIGVGMHCYSSSHRRKQAPTSDLQEAAILVVEGGKMAMNSLTKAVAWSRSLQLSQSKTCGHRKGGGGGGVANQ